MPCQLRIEYPGAILATLAEACAKTEWQMHAYCVMHNHFHLVVETPKVNLPWFLSTYTARFNRRHKLFGHLFGLRLLAICVFLLFSIGCSMLGPLSQLAVPAASAKLMFACLPSSASIDTPSGPRGIEVLEPGDSVIGFDGQPVGILQKHSYLEETRTEFLRITFSDGPSIELCGMHRVAGTRARSIKVGQTIDGRVVSSIQSRFGETRSYDLLTEDAGYRIAGVRVNSMIQEMQAAAASGLRGVRD